MLQRIFALVCAFAFVCLPVHSQTPQGYLPVTQNNLLDSNGNKVNNATACAQITLGGQASSVQVGGSAVATFNSVCAPVSNGAWQMNLPDMTTAVPHYACVNLSVTDNLTGNSLLSGYGCIQPRSKAPQNIGGAPFWCNTTTGCSLDLLTPNYPASDAFVAPVGLQGPQGPSGCVIGQTCSAFIDPVAIAGVLDAKGNGVAGDGSTDDTVALNALMNKARQQNAAVYLPSSTYSISNTIDMRGLHVYGAGRDQTILSLTAGASVSSVYASQGSRFENFQIYGGWDYKSSAQSATGPGSCIEGTSTDPGSTSQLPYRMTFEHMTIGGCKSDGIYLIDAAYTLIFDNQVLGVAGRDLALDSHKGGGGFQSTSTTVLANTLGSTLAAAQPSIYINDGVNDRIQDNTMEDSTGIKVVGGANRALLVEGNYVEEYTAAANQQFLALAGSGGIGLSVHGNRAGVTAGPAPNDLANWGNWDISGNWFANGDLGNGGFPDTVRATSQFFDPIAKQPQEYVINPGAQTAMSQAIFTNSGSWSAILHGTFVDFTGGVSALPPEVIVNSNAPTVAMGHTSVTFSMSSAGYLQATVSANCCSATTVRFLGWVEVYNDRGHGASPFGLLSAAPIYTGGLTSTGPITGSTVGASNGYTGQCPAGQTPVFTAGIATGCQ